MAFLTYWPREAINALGRPLNRWDLCPVCGQMPKGHTNANVEGESRLACISSAKNNSFDRWDQERRDADVEQRRKDRAAIAEATEIERKKQLYIDRIAMAEANEEIEKRRDERSWRETAATREAVEPKRKYFDE